MLANITRLFCYNSKLTAKNSTVLLNTSLKPSWCHFKLYGQNFSSRELTLLDEFQKIKNKDKDTYLEMVNIYKDKSLKRRDHVEFIYAALKHMKEFGVDKDLDVYKSLIDVLPKGKMIPKNVFQVEFMHYPKHQQCAIDLLEQMEENGVMPDWNMEDQLVNVFGRRGYPVRRYWRMMYWMPKFKNASPWLLPRPVPNDAFQLAMLAVQRITSVDVNTEITTYQTNDIPDSLEDTWIISAQSLDQKKLLKTLPTKTPVYVEGRFQIWLRDKAVTYFVLRSDLQEEIMEREDNVDDLKSLKNPLFAKPSNSLKRKPTVHEQSDGIILAVCTTGTSSRDSLLSWIRSLEKTNPYLSELAVVFTLKSTPVESLAAINDTFSNDMKEVHVKERKIE